MLTLIVLTVLLSSQWTFATPIRSNYTTESEDESVQLYSARGTNYGSLSRVNTNPLSLGAASSPFLTEGNSEWNMTALQRLKLPAGPDTIRRLDKMEQNRKSVIRTTSLRQFRPKLSSDSAIDTSSVTPWDSQPAPPSPSSSTSSNYFVESNSATSRSIRTSSFSGSKSLSGFSAQKEETELPMTVIPMNELLASLKNGNDKSNTIRLKGPLYIHKDSLVESNKNEKENTILPHLNNELVNVFNAKKVDFKKLLQDQAESPLSLASFRDYCASVMKSPELLDFYEAIESYKHLWSERKSVKNTLGNQKILNEIEDAIDQLAHRIVIDFIAPGSPFEVNLPSDLCKPLLTEESIDISVSTFNPVQEHVYEMMRQNALPRYLATFKQNVSCPSKVPCAAMVILSALAFLPHFLYQFITDTPQIQRLELFPSLFFLIMASVQLQQRFCVIYWVRDQMQQPTKMEKLHAIMLRVKDPYVSQLQREYLKVVVTRGMAVFLVAATILIFIPSLPLNNYRWV